MQLTTRRYLRALRLGLVLAGVLSLSGQARSQQHNLLIIVSDDQGVDSIGCYAEGSNPPPTPNLDALANRGVLFRNAWACATCSPARASFLTGRYPFRTGIGDAVVPNGTTPGLDYDETLLPEMMDIKGLGYQHAAIGKWHLTEIVTNGANDSAPNLHGFSHYAGYLNGAVPDYYAWPRTVDGVTATSTTYATTQIIDDALAWIGQAQEPWLCYVALTAPHFPYHAPPSHLHSENLTGLDPNAQPFPFYRAMVEAMDNEIGRLLSSLGSVEARTNVMFFSDNGTAPEVVRPPFDPSHGKRSAYEGGLNVPFIVAGPAVQGAVPREESALISVVDLYDTAIELAGGTPGWPLVRSDSMSFFPLLQDPQASAPRSTVYSDRFFGAGPSFSGFSTVRDERYKLIWTYSLFGLGKEQFFDLLADPLETTNLMGSLDPQQQLAYAALRTEMETLRDRSPQVIPFGTGGCQGSNGVPQIGIIGLPRINDSYQVTLSNGVPGGVSALLVGFSRTEFRGLPLPLDLSLFGGGIDCAVFVAPDIAATFPVDGTGQIHAPMALPDMPVLLDGVFYHSWLGIDPLAPSNTLGVTSSTALELVIGR
ncbi:MAG: sulfatase-like hydrolase/transferase [Planctomycetes bacterium]|nr:sulfatase-like hydrolase/transferase [Planctomycetota bacterium]